MTTTKITYTATDPAGIVHERTSDRVFAYAVVVLPSYEHDLAVASDKHHAPQDRRNWEYYVAIINGRDPYPEKCYRTALNSTPEQIDEERISVQRQQAKKITDAKAEIGENDQGLAGYLDRKLTQRITFVEKRKSQRYYDTFQIAGWCGCRDLAEKLAAKYAVYGMLDVTILTATEKADA